MKTILLTQAVTDVADTVADTVDTTTNVVQEASHNIIPDFLQSYVDKCISFLIVLIVCVIIAKIVLKMVNKALDALNMELTLKKFIQSVIKVLVYAIAALAIASEIGINISSVVALGTVASAAFALAAQGSLSNLFGGILLLITKPFLVGDYVTIAGVDGTVLEIGLLTTKINTADNKRVSIPNGSISSATIVNFSTEGKRRVDLKVTASYDAPLDTVKTAVLDAVANTPKVLNEPQEPFCAVSNYGESSIEYSIRVWASTPDYWDVYWGIMQNLKPSFDKFNVEMTYNHLNVHMLDK